MRARNHAPLAMFVWLLTTGILLGFTRPAQAEWPCVTIRAQTVIDAPYDLVFDTIVDTASYPEWNPYIIKVTPASTDVSQVGSEFVLTVDQPFQLFHTESPEKTIRVELPGGGRALLVYGYNDALAPLVGNPERIQRFTALSEAQTRYETEEKFCTLLLPLLPLLSVQTGFQLQTLALKREAERRFALSQ